jgi:hypothetical protein
MHAYATPCLVLQGLSNTVWVLARLSMPPDAYLERLLGTCLARLADFTAVSLANLIWALTKLRHRPSDDFAKCAAAWCFQYFTASHTRKSVA